MKKILMLFTATILALGSTCFDSTVHLNDGNGEPIELNAMEMFFHVEEKAYIIEDTYAKEEPYQDSKDVLYLPKYEQVTLIGKNNFDYWEILVDDEIYYVNVNSFTVEEEVYKEVVSQTYNHKWKGKTLTKKLGTVKGPSGKETFYNMKMDRVVANMRKRGNKDKYWIREDGCKMLGDYIIVAANLSVHPRGSLVQTSLGTGIVCDTGAFAHRNPTQIDIAVDWTIKKK